METDPTLARSPKATVTINQDLVGIWYICHIPNRADFLCGLYDLGNGMYEISSRFKYYSSPVAFDPSDERSHYTARTRKPTTREKAIGLARGAMEVLSKKSGIPYDEILVVNKDLDKFWAELHAKPWANMMIVPAGEN